MVYRTASLLSVIGSTCTRQTSSKAEPPQPASPPPPLFLPPGLRCHILREAKWQVTLHTLGTFISQADLDLHVKNSTMGRLYCVSCRPVRAPASNLSVCKRTRPWHRFWRATRTQAVLYLLCNCEVWTWKFTGADENCSFCFFVVESETATLKKTGYFLTMSQVNLTCPSLMEEMVKGRNRTKFSGLLLALIIKTTKVQL